MNFITNPAGGAAQNHSYQGNRTPPVDRRGSAANASSLDAAERARLASQLKTLIWGASIESLILLFDDDDVLLAVVAKLEQLKVNPAPSSTPAAPTPVPAANRYDGYSINEVIYESDPNMAHLDSVAKRMVCELHQHHVFPALNDADILAAYEQLIVENARSYKGT